MTATRDRLAGRRELGGDERSLLSTQPGAPWWAAIALALVITAAGAFADLYRLGRLGFLFQACYCLACVLAVVVVQRKGLFGPMVQPPLILALAVPGVVLLAGPAPTGGGLTAAGLAVATPLINGFPTMAITTLLTLGLGGIRLLVQRSPAARPEPPPDSGPRPGAPPRPPARAGKPAARPARATKSPARPVLGTPAARPAAGLDSEQTDPAIQRPRRSRPTG